MDRRITTTVIMSASHRGHIVAAGARDQLFVAERIILHCNFVNQSCSQISCHASRLLSNKFKKKNIKLVILRLIIPFQYEIKSPFCLRLA